MRLDEIVAELIDENLVAGVDRAARDHLAAAVDVPGPDLEILAQGIRRRIDEKILARADDAGKGEEEAKLLRHDPLHAVVFLRNDVDVIASEDEELNDATNDIRRRLRARMTDDPVQASAASNRWES